MTAASAVAPRGGVREGVWRLADPKISLASMASMLLGAGAAFHDGSRAFGWLALVVIGIFAIEVAKNASGEVFDYDSGTDLAVSPEDRSPFSGGKRVMVDGLLTRAQTWRVALVGYALCAIAGIAIVLVREPRVLPLGIAGALLAFFYHAPPFKLSYRGLGELAVFVAYGPLLCAGTYLVMRGTMPSWVVWLSVPLGILIAAFLWANEFPDFRSDAGAGKRTLVVRLGRVRASRVFALLVAAAMALAAALPLAGAPVGALAGLVAAVPAAQSVATLLRSPEETARVVPAQAKILIAFLLYAAGAAVGIALV